MKCYINYLLLNKRYYEFEATSIYYKRSRINLKVDYERDGIFKNSIKIFF